MALISAPGEPKAKSIKRKSDNSKKAKPAPKRAKEAPAGHAVMALPKTDVFLSTDDDGDYQFIGQPQAKSSTPAVDQRSPSDSQKPTTNDAPPYAPPQQLALRASTSTDAIQISEQVQLSTGTKDMAEPLALQHAVDERVEAAIICVNPTSKKQFDAISHKRIAPASADEEPVASTSSTSIAHKTRRRTSEEAPTASTEPPPSATAQQPHEPQPATNHTPRSQIFLVRKEFSVRTKLDAIDRSKVIGKRAAEREIRASEGSIRNWIANEDVLRDLAAQTTDQEPLSSVNPVAGEKTITVQVRLDAIDRAKVIGNSAAARENGVSDTAIRNWRKKEAQLRASLPAPEQLMAQEPSPSIRPAAEEGLVASASANSDDTRQLRKAAMKANEAMQKYVGACDQQTNVHNRKEDGSEYDVQEAAMARRDGDEKLLGSEKEDSDSVELGGPGPSTFKKQKRKPRSSKQPTKCPVCHFAGARDEMTLHLQLSRHDEYTSVMCDFPGCGHRYAVSNQEHLLHHYGEPIVCGIDNGDGTSCKLTTYQPSTISKHRSAAHGGTFRCSLCNWCQRAETTAIQHAVYHLRVKVYKHVSTYNGPVAPIPIRGMEDNICPEAGCPQKVVCMSHFVWHLRYEHTIQAKDSCSETVHVRCDLCGQCMPVNHALRHQKWHCFYTIFPEVQEVMGGHEGESENNLTICDCRGKPIAPRQFNDRLMKLMEASRPKDVTAMLGCAARNALVKVFFEDNSNAPPDSAMYAIVQVDPSRVHTLADFFHRILYIGSSTDIKNRDVFSYRIHPLPADSTEVRYRIRLGATIGGKGFWQFGEHDAVVLETFVTLFLSVRNLWNREYPRGAQSCRVNDRFMKFVPSFDAISTVVLLGAYDEIVVKRNWNDWRVSRFTPIAEEPATVHTTIAQVPLTRMSTQETRASFIELAIKTAALTGTRPQDLIAGVLKELLAKDVQEVQTDTDADHAEAHSENNASMQSPSDDHFAPDDYEIEEARLFLRKQEELQDQLEASGYRPQSPLFSAYRYSSLRYEPVFEVIPRPGYAVEEDPNDAYISESESDTPVKQQPATRSPLSPRAALAQVETGQEAECSTSRLHLAVAPSPKTLKLRDVCADACSTSDGPQSAKSVDSGVGMTFGFARATESDALLPLAADGSAVVRPVANPNDTAANASRAEKPSFPSPEAPLHWDGSGYAPGLPDDPLPAWTPRQDGSPRTKFPRRVVSQSTSAGNGTAPDGMRNSPAAVDSLKPTSISVRVLKKSLARSDLRVDIHASSSSSSTANRISYADERIELSYE